MRIFENRILSKIVPFLLIGVIILLLVNKSLYIHTHKMADGTIVVHAHPFDKAKESSSGTTHKHTKFEIFFFNNINLLFLVCILFLLSVLYERGQKLILYNLRLYSFLSYARIPARAPPFKF